MQGMLSAMNAVTTLLTLVFGLLLWVGAFAQEAEDFIRAVDKSPAEKRPPGWEKTKELMARKPPAVGDVAPDFTLKSLDGEKSVTRSKLPPGKPQVLIFGSYT